MIKYTEKALEELINEKKSVLVVAHTDWCSSCRRVLPLIQELEVNYQNKVIFVDIDADFVSDNYVKKFEVEELPTVNMVVKGKVCPPCKNLDTPESIKAYIAECLSM